MSSTHSRLDRLALPLLLLAGLALHLPWLWAPFGFQDINAGGYFGPFAQSWERFGFFELRGVPLGAWVITIPELPADGLPYFNHPPAFAWLSGMFGSAEWQVRLASVLAVTIAGPLMFLLARRHLGPWSALVAGLLVQAVPTVAYASVLSYESPVLACGLALWLLHERAGHGSIAARWGVAAMAFVGAWMDWAFGFYVLALLPLSLPAGGGTLARRLWQPWLACFIGTLLVVAWTWWARQAPCLQPLRSVTTFSNSLNYAVFSGPPPAVFWKGLGIVLRDAFTWPVLAVAAIGLLPALWKAPWLMLTAFLPALLNIGIFRNHSSSHLHFVAYLAPAVAFAVASLLDQLGRRRALRLPAIVVAVGLVALVAWDSSERKRGASQQLFARFGATVTEVADGPSPDADKRPVLIATNVPQYYPYYVRSPRVLLTPVLSPTDIDRQRGGGARLRYVYVQTELRLAGQNPVSPPDEPLRKWLEQFPRHELPQLIGTWPLGRGDDFVVLGAWVYDL